MHKLCIKKNIDYILVSRTGTDHIKGSVADFKFVSNLITTYKPDYIFNFAANSTTKHDALFENQETISTGTLNILESCYRHSSHSKILIVGSGVQFKNTGKPISEKDEFEANSPYAVARIQSVYAARYYRNLGLQTYVAYLFHHESPYRKENHVSKMIASKIKNILAGTKEVIEIGDPTVRKEWGFAEDIVEGIFTLVSQENIFEAAVGTGQPYTIGEYIEECFKQAKLSKENYVKYLCAYKSEYSILYSDPATIHDLGWKAKTSFKELVKIMVFS